MFRVVFFLFISVFFAYAEPLVLEPVMKEIPTAAHIAYYKDATKKITLQQIQKERFSKGKKEPVNKGASKADWWLRLEVKNPADKALEWILKFNFRQFDTLEAWQVDEHGNTISHSLKGDLATNPLQTSFKERCIFHFTTKANTTDTVYVKLSYAQAGIMETFNTVWTPKEFYMSQQTDYYLMTVILSSLGILLFYNFFIWFILRKREYFWYNIYLVGVILAMLTFDQLGAQYIWYESAYMIDMMPFIASATLFIAFLQFTRRFLETKKLLPKIDNVLKLLVYLNILGFILANLGERYYGVVLIQMISFTFIFFPFIGLYLWTKGYKIARGYTLASSILSVTVMISILRATDILSTNELLFWVGRLGFILEGVFLSIALADRITILEYNYVNEQNKVKRTLEEAKENLTLEVQKRTQELEIQTKKAQELARRDEMTGLYNRRAFIEFGGNLVKEALRYESSFSLIIMDIDHFKNINDRYGHDAGDAVLREFAREMLSHIRDTDFLARIGGEEFVLLLSNTQEKQALIKAEELSHRINAMRIVYKNFTLKVSASMGVCEFSHETDTLSSLLSKADEALYHVKENGRNGIRLFTKQG